MAIEKQIWIDLIKEGMTPDTSFLSRSVDMSDLVEHNKINLAEAGVEPNVIIDNKVYPVPTASREDAPLELPLHTFDTENTVVRNIEEKESAYPKMESVTRGHRRSLIRKTSANAAYNWCPTKDSDMTPVLAASGDISKAGYKKVSFEDFLNLEAKFRGLDVDMNSLVAVLNAYHLADLMAEDMKLYKEVLAAGKLFSFSLFSFNNTATFDGTTGQKKAYGAAADPTKDAISSLVYCDTEVMRASGDTEIFVTYKDPKERGDILGFQQRFTALPIRSKYIGAIYSGK